MDTISQRDGREPLARKRRELSLHRIILVSNRRSSRVSPTESSEANSPSPVSDHRPPRIVMVSTSGIVQVTQAPSSSSPSPSRRCYSKQYDRGSERVRQVRRKHASTYWRDIRDTRQGRRTRAYTTVPGRRGSMRRDRVADDHFRDKARGQTPKEPPA